MLSVSGDITATSVTHSGTVGALSQDTTPPVDVSDWPSRAPDVSLDRVQQTPAPSVSGAPAADVRAHALLAQDVYNDTPQPPAGYRAASSHDLAMLELSPSDLQNGEFRARVYVTGEGEETRYVIAFRGTQSAEGWVSNVRQGVGTDSAHYRDALLVADRVAASGLAGRVSFTGHSLGGGLASAASVATGAPSHTFNAAGLHENTIAAADAVRSGYGIETAGDVQAWYVRGEALSSFQDGGDRIAGWLIGGIPGALFSDAPEAYGDRHALDPVAPEGKGFFDRIDPVDRHGMDWVTSSLP